MSDITNRLREIAVEVRAHDLILVLAADTITQLRAKLDTMTAERNGLRIALNEARSDMAAALSLVADVRAAIGDAGKRMQPELIDHCKAMKKDAERYRWLRECGDAFDQLSVFDSRGNLVDEFLDRAIDAAMGGGNG